MINESAGTVITLVRDRRVLIRKARMLAETLLHQLGDAVENRDKTIDAINDMYAHVTDTSRRNALLRAISLPTHVATLKDLAMAQRSFIALERQAFGIPELFDPEPTARQVDDVHPTDVALRRLTQYLKFDATRA